jgi:hypothetical protein
MDQEEQAPAPPELDDPYDLGRIIECEECGHSYDQLDGDGLCGYCAGRAFELDRGEEKRT